MFAGLSVRTLIVRTVALAGIVVMTFPSTSTSAAQDSDCTVEERRNVLRAMQAQVLEVAPRQLDSLEKAIEPRAVLVEWILSHGHVVFAHSGAVPVGNARATHPWPAAPSVRAFASQFTF
jgi:peroxiredoxin